MIKKIVGNSRIILLIFLAMATLMILSALIELNQSKQELYDLMENQAHSLLESVTSSSANALNRDNTVSIRFLK